MIPGASRRLDLMVLDKLPDLSRSFGAKLIEQGLVKVNGNVITKSSFKVGTGDKVLINYTPKPTPKSSALDLPIIYEDDDCIVINKPEGILSHSKGAFNPEPTVASWLAQHFKGEMNERAGIVHRLDRATSGVMILAKDEAAHKWLQKQFATRKVKKSYMALVKGSLKEDQALIDLPIERNPKKPQTFRVGAQGKSAQTGYTVIDRSNQYSLIELKPTTGRTHQLRVHLAYLGHPILGDNLYNGAEADRLYLHATSLEITLPSRQRATFETKLPVSFKEILKNDK